jgi:O-antigen/teichoic acid export membrane protein
MIDTIKKFMTSGHVRSVRIKKHIVASFFIKFISIFVSYAILPLTINYLDSTRYGIWITLSSILAWFSFFDIGLGQGLRNKLAESLASDNKELAKIYISTTYFALFGIMAAVYMIYLLVSPLVDWSTILNTDMVDGTELSVLVLVVFTFFCLRFILSLIGKILLADQRPAVNASLGPAGNLVALVIIYILTKTTSGSLLYLGLVMSAAPVVVLLIASIYLFMTDYKEYRPRIRYVDMAYFADLIGVGSKFFFINIAGVIVFTSSNLLISQLYGPAEVTPYNIAYKYFGLSTMVFGIILSPIWSSVTEAYVKQEYGWIKGVIRKMYILWLGAIVVIIMMILGSDTLYKLWIGQNHSVASDLTIAMGIYTIIHLFGIININIINGIGRIQLQLYLSIFETIVFIPTAIMLGRIYGIAGIVYARIIIIAPLVTIIFIQLRRLVKPVHGEFKIWSK